MSIRGNLSFRLALTRMDAPQLRELWQETFGRTQRWVDGPSDPGQLLVVAGYLKRGRSHAFTTNALDAWPVLLDGPRFRLLGGVFCLGAEVFSVLQVAVVGDS